MTKFSTKYYLVFLISWLFSIQADAQSVGGNTSGASTFCDTINSGFISVIGYNGSILNWEYSTDGGTIWTNIANTTPVQSYSNLTQTTCYRAIVKSGAFPPDTSTVTCMTVYMPSIGGIISGGGTFCAGSGPGTLNLTGNTGNPLYWEYSTDSGATWLNVANTTTLLNYISITQNTIYQAVVQNGTGCPSDTSSQVSFILDPVSDAGVISGSDTVCYGVNFGTISLSGYTGTITKWISSSDFGATWTSISNTTPTQSYSGLTQTTLFAAIVKSGSCSSDTSSPAGILVAFPSPAYAGNDTTILLGQSAMLHGIGNGSVVWSPAVGLSNNTIFTPIATPASTTAYVLSVTDSIGCISTDAVTVTVILPQFNGAVSNLFTPNGDGINDSWYIRDIQNFPDNEVVIYNIYGNKVFEKKGYANDWMGTYNGSDLPDGTYYFVLKLDDKSDIVKGSLDILRNK